MMFFSKALAIYLEGSILNLVEHYLRLTDVFYFSSICIKEPKKKSFIFFVSCVLRDKSVKRSLCTKNRDFFKKYNFVILCDFTEGQNLSAWI